MFYVLFVHFLQVSVWDRSTHKKKKEKKNAFSRKNTAFTSILLLVCAFLTGVNMGLVHKKVLSGER